MVARVLAALAAAVARNGADPIGDRAGCDLNAPPADPTRPTLHRTVFVSGLSKPWDLGFLPTGEMLLTERGGRLALCLTSEAVITVARVTDGVVSGEG